MMKILRILLLLSAGAVACGAEAQQPAAAQRDFNVQNFHFASGQTLAELRLHFRTLGEPQRGANGLVDNAVLLLHGQGGSGAEFLTPSFAGALFGKGQPLDASKYYIILPDEIGSGASSKPSDGLRMRFPNYTYADMVSAEHLLVTQGLSVDHLRLIIGVSGGCRQTWIWGETFPGFADALLPMGCLPAPIAGRSRMVRKLETDAIKDDPAWRNGNYRAQPQALKQALALTLITDSSPRQLRQEHPTAAATDAYMEQWVAARFRSTDANDFLYRRNAARAYDPSAKLSSISAPALAINAADDFFTPPDLGLMPRLVGQLPRGKFVLLPITPESLASRSYLTASLWEKYLTQLLEESGPAAPKAPPIFNRP